MTAPTKRLLWVDDEIDLLRPHLLFVQGRGYHIDAVANGDDALELIRLHPYDLVLLDEQMPGRSGMEVFDEIRRLDPLVPVVMVTKSEEDRTMTEAIGRRVADYLVKPTSPRQILSVVTRLLEGESIQQQHVAREFAARFRELNAQRGLVRGWREWSETYSEIVDWELKLREAGETGLLASLDTLLDDFRREFCRFVVENYSDWVNGGADRPPLSVDLVPQFLMPLLGSHRRVLFVIIDCLRLDQWRSILPILANYAEVEEALYYSILPSATPYSRNAIFSGWFPDQIAELYPGWWDREGEGGLNNFEDELFSAQLKRLAGHELPLHYEKVFSANDGEQMLHRLPAYLAQPGVTAVVFNFVDMLTHGRSESAILLEVARDNEALRALSRQWFERSEALTAIREAIRAGIPVLVTTDHGSIHCHRPVTVYAKRDATQNLRYKFGDDLRAQDRSLVFSVQDEAMLRFPAGRTATKYLIGLEDAFFVYPTKLRQYQARYRGSFLHGGVSPEEMILPVALLTPQMKLYLRILGFLKPHAGVFMLSIGAMIVFAALDAASFLLLIPFLGILFGSDPAGGGVTDIFQGANWLDGVLHWAVGDLIEQNAPMVALRNVVLLLFVIFLVKNLALYLQQYTVAIVQGRVTRDLRNAIYDQLLRMGFPYFQRTRTGQLISRVTVDVDQIRALVTQNLARALSSVIQVVFLLTLLLLLSWKLTLVAALSLPPMLGLWARFRTRLRVGVLRVLDAVGELASHVQETVSGIRLVKASGAERWEARRFRELTHRHYKAYIRNERWRQFFPPATEMVIAIAILGLLWYGTYLVLEEQSLSPEAFLVALGYAMKLMAPAKFLGQFPSVVQPGLAAADRAFEILDAPPEIVERANARSVPPFREALRLEDVSFHYQPGEPVLQGIDLTVRPGEVVALVGPSGAGKSTLADLVPRFQDPTSGRVTLDGADLRELRLSELRDQLGIVTQETILFHDTVRANIAYGTENPAPEAVEAAARAAHAHEFIVEMPEGYDTVLGERGVRLSGGQRQRIAIARALFRNPPILILDEATSALDTESERLVQQAIEELVHDRTVLVIAHRLSTVRRADQIVVLEAGRVVERGSHDELLAIDGTYRRLYRLQFAGGEEG